MSDSRLSVTPRSDTTPALVQTPPYCATQPLTSCSPRVKYCADFEWRQRKDLRERLPEHTAKISPLGAGSAPRPPSRRPLCVRRPVPPQQWLPTLNDAPLDMNSAKPRNDREKYAQSEPVGVDKLRGAFCLLHFAFCLLIVQL